MTKTKETKQEKSKRVVEIVKDVMDFTKDVEVIPTDNTNFVRVYSDSKDMCSAVITSLMSIKETKLICIAHQSVVDNRIYALLEIREVN